VEIDSGAKGRSQNTENKKIPTCSIPGRGKILGIKMAANAIRSLGSDTFSSLCNFGKLGGEVRPAIITGRCRNHILQFFVESSIKEIRKD